MGNNKISVFDKLATIENPYKTLYDECIEKEDNLLKKGNIRKGFYKTFESSSFFFGQMLEYGPDFIKRLIGKPSCIDDIHELSKIFIKDVCVGHYVLETKNNDLTEDEEEYMYLHSIRLILFTMSGMFTTMFEDCAEYINKRHKYENYKKN